MRRSGESTTDPARPIAARIGDDSLKEQVRAFWNRRSCDTHIATAPKFSLEYFEEIERFRYLDQPFIHAFAQFPRYHGKRVLEVGIGAGTDFVQWLRVGATASGIDLTDEALSNVRHRVDLYELPEPEHLSTGDAESLEFESNRFDLCYSFGVLHHTPDTPRALAELVRVTKPEGEIKVMLYNLHSIAIFKRWVKHSVLRGRPWHGLRHAAWHHTESIGTKAYSRRDLRRMLGALPLEDVVVRTEVTASDHLAFSAVPPLNWVCRFALRIAGNNQGWRRADYVTGSTSEPPRSHEVRFLGNRLGMFHCISARKRL